MIWRISIFVYLLLGGAFVVWQSKRWWREQERAVEQFKADHGGEIPRWAFVAVVVVGSFAGLVSDLAFWPHSALVWWRERKERRMLRRAEEHGDFCHCDECDGDD
jgi:hypothetical protein